MANDAHWVEPYGAVRPGARRDAWWPSAVDQSGYGNVFEPVKGALAVVSLKASYPDQQVKTLKQEQDKPTYLELQPFEVLVFDMKPDAHWTTDGRQALNATCHASRSERHVFYASADRLRNGFLKGRFRREKEGREEVPSPSGKYELKKTIYFYFVIHSCWFPTVNDNLLFHFRTFKEISDIKENHILLEETLKFKIRLTVL